MAWAGDEWNWTWICQRDFTHAAAWSIRTPDFVSCASGERTLKSFTTSQFPGKSRRWAPYHEDTREQTALGGFALTHLIRKTAAASSKWKRVSADAPNGSAGSAPYRLPAAAVVPVDVVEPCVP